MTSAQPTPITRILSSLELLREAIEEFSWTELPVIRVGQDPEEFRSKSPTDGPGIYFFSRAEELLYVGKATTLRSRYSPSMRSTYAKPDKIIVPWDALTEACRDGGCDYRHVELPSKYLVAVESLLIERLKPKWNKRS